MSSDAPSPRWLSLHTVWLVLLPAAVLLVLDVSTVVQPNDFWWHVRTGEMILHGGIPTVDHFSFSQNGTPWVNQAWLMQIVLYAEHRAGGLPLVVFAHGLMLAGGYTLLMLGAIRRTALRPGVLATVVGVALGVVHWNVRPQSFSFLAFGALVFLLEMHRAGRRRWIWAVPPLFAVWVNAHGGFVFGIAALTLIAIGRALAWWPRRHTEDRAPLLHLAGATAASIAALALNPTGPLGILRYVAGFFTSHITMAYNVEFRPLDLVSVPGLLFVASLLAYGLLSWRGRRGMEGIADAPAILAFAGLSLWAHRAMPWLGFVLAAPLAAALASAWKQAPVQAGRPVANAALLALLLILSVLALPWLRPVLAPEGRRSLASVETPIEATRFLCDELPDDARVFQTPTIASYQIWACPRLPVFVDTRMELYPDAHWLATVAIMTAHPDWPEIVERYRITHLFLEPSRNAALVEAALTKGWHPLYRDDRAVILSHP